jgi:hypothetical protein
VAAVIAGDDAHGFVDLRHEGTCFELLSTRTDMANRTTAAPLPNGRRSDGIIHDLRRPTAVEHDLLRYGGLRRIRDVEHVQEVRLLTLDAWETTAGAEVR